VEGEYILLGLLLGRLKLKVFLHKEICKTLHRRKRTLSPAAFFFFFGRAGGVVDVPKKVSKAFAFEPSEMRPLLPTMTTVGQELC
jgi:hypothetical protein